MHVQVVGKEEKLGLSYTLTLNQLFDPWKI